MKQAIWNEKVIAESDETTVLEGNHYFPSNCIKKDFFKSNDTQSACPWKGTASYYDLVVDGQINKDAAWYYAEVSEMAKKIEGFVAFGNGVEIKTKHYDALLTKYKLTRARTEAICSPLEIEDYVPQLAAFASPPKWHLAHTTWFFETMILQKFVSGYQIYHPNFSFLFNSYYESVGKRTINSHRGHITRPTVKEVYAYRKYVNEAMFVLLNELLTEEIEQLVVLGINHEQQHQELLWTDLKFTLGHNPIFPVYEAGYDDLKSNKQSQDFVKVSAGNYEVGFEGEDFHFDNEKVLHMVYLEGYEIANFLVTNKEYLTFIAEGGYQNFQYWLDDGWAWVQQHEIIAPLYWVKKNNEWYQYALSGLQKVKPENILTHISFYEAQAFANWKGMRLPTEFEWEVASVQLNWGQRWEWTNSAYLPYPKYKAAEGAVGEYNGKFMINQMVLRGASIATAKGHERNTYRNFFAPYHQWQYTGIRLIK